MTVFKTFWKIVKKYKGMIILYTVLLIVFGGINLSTSENVNTFIKEKPNVLIINKDENIGITKNLIQYIEKNTNRVKIEKKEDKIKDALFYREVNYIIYIKENYRKEVLEGKNPTLEIKKVEDVNASLTELLLKRYLKVQNIYVQKGKREKEIIENINNSLKEETKVEITSKLDTDKMEKVTLYFNFASYSIMAVIIFIISLILSSFHEKQIHKRITVSSMPYQKHNKIILKASILYTLIVWILFILLGIILLKEAMLSIKGLLYMINAFVFAICSLTLALFISSLTNNKEAVSGIVNVVALGSAFLCGAFVPVEWLPKNVLTFAHILPSYWFINTNEFLKKLEKINISTIKPFLVNILVLIIFSILFIIINNKVMKRKQKIG